MKKILMTAGVIALAITTVAAAYTFSVNLTVGSTGADVVALQTALMSAGYDIPAISSGAAAKGYFGSQTKAAVQRYQAANGIPSTGFVGPLTRAKLNGGVAVVPAATCPAGYTCTPINGGPIVNNTSGVPGTLIPTLQSNYNNVTLNKGKSENVARIKLQANASDMKVSSISFDVDQRLWLYVGAVTLTDDSGTVIAVQNLSQASLSELTVGSNYRLTIPVNYTVVHGMTQYVTINFSALATSDRDAGTINITSAQVRAVDGTGVNDTETVSGTFPHAISYQSSGNANIVTTIDTSSPRSGLIQISTAVETDNVLLAAFQIKSQNTQSTLRTLKLTVTTGASTTNQVFNEVKVRIGGTTYSADSVAPGTTTSGVATFTNLNVNLSADQYITVSVYGRVAKNINDTVSVTLTASTANVVIEDSSFNAVSAGLSGGSITSETLQFTATGVVASAPSAVVSGVISDSGTSTGILTFNVNLTAGNNAIYVSKTNTTALSISNSNAAVTVTKLDWKDSNTQGDSTGTTVNDFFYIAPGQTKTFTATYSASAATGVHTVFKITALNVGSTALLATSTPDIILNSSDVQNALSATF